MDRNFIEYFDYNSTVTLSMFFISLLIVGLNKLTKNWFTKNIFSTERDSLLNPMTYLRFFTHILGHRDWKHFASNYMKILLLGPLIEEKYGSINFLIMILVTAFVTGIINFFTKNNLKGASGIVFMLIALSAFVNMTGNKIPLTVVLIIIFYFIDEVKGLGKKDSIAHYGHLIGAFCGIAFGLLFLTDNPWQTVINFFNNLF